jgi:hypothetical protein
MSDYTPEAVCEGADVDDEPTEKAIAIIDAMEMANQFLDEFALTRPSSIPVGWIRMQMNIKSNGPCPRRGLRAIKEKD